MSNSFLGIKSITIMMLSLFLPFILSIEALTTTASAISDERIEQKLDHFNTTDKRTWQMRYFSNSEHFRAGGPLFIFIGGEWEIGGFHISKGRHFVDIAKEHNGYLFYTEYRYYGKSIPTSEFSTATLQKYLHIKQALADLAHFIRYKKQTIPEFANSKVIIAGGSYAGTMVTWFKRLYPDLVVGGWASSAPLVAQLDIVEFNVITGRAYQVLGSQKCYDRIKNGIAELEKSMMNTNNAKKIIRNFNICNNFNEHNELDVWTFFSFIKVFFEYITLYGDIKISCNQLLQDDLSDDLTAILNISTFSKHKLHCTDLTHNSTVNQLKDITKGKYLNMFDSAWFFQKCNEYGWFHSTASVKQPFGTKIPIKHYTTLCKDAYGLTYTIENINEKIAQTNKQFGGLSPNVTNIYQTHGELDPWSVLGHDQSQGATVIPNGLHCSDLDSIKGSDRAELRASKERIAALVREWLA